MLVIGWEEVSIIGRLSLEIFWELTAYVSFA